MYCGQTAVKASMRHISPCLLYLFSELLMVLPCFWRLGHILMLDKPFTARDMEDIVAPQRKNETGIKQVNLGFQVVRHYPVTYR
jgi:hypothetical protein